MTKQHGAFTICCTRITKTHVTKRSSCTKVGTSYYLVTLILLRKASTWQTPLPDSHSLLHPRTMHLRPPVKASRDHRRRMTCSYAPIVGMNWGQAKMTASDKSGSSKPVAMSIAASAPKTGRQSKRAKGLEPLHRSHSPNALSRVV